MLKVFQKRDVLVRVFLGFVVGLIGLMMVITLAPGPVGSLADNPAALAQIGNQQVTMSDVQRELGRIERTQPIPPTLRPFYTRQIVDQLIYARLIEYEARRVGMRVTEQEHAERIKLLVPTSFEGDRFLGMERYSQEVQVRFNIPVAEFEDLVRKSILEEKFRRLITDGVSVTPEEIEQEFRRRNEKVKLDYVALKPEDLQSQVATPESEVAAYYEKNKSRYQVPERRSARYVLLDPTASMVAPTDAELRAFYNENIDRFRLQDRARVSHILFKTIGRTDAEVQEIEKKAEDVLKQARRPGAKFEDLAKQHSEDTSKENAGDLGWIVRGQTVPEFEQAAFTLPKGSISNVVKTQYGFHIVKVIDRESARTRSFEEVRNEIFPVVAARKSQQAVEQQADRLADAVRQSTRRPIEEIAQQFNLPIRDFPPVAVGENPAGLGRAPELVDGLFRAQAGQLGGPLRMEAGHVVYVLKDVQPAHQGTLAEVRDRVLDDYRRDKAAELAKSRATELAQRAKSAGLAQAAKSLGLEKKSSEALARTASLPDVGPLRQLGDVFSQSVGFTSDAISAGGRWVVYAVVEHQASKPEDLARQRTEIEQQVLQSKRQVAYDAFRSELERRLRAEGELQVNEENLKRVTQQPS